MASTLHYDPILKVINGGDRSISKSEMDERGIGYLLFDSMKKWSEKGFVAQIDEQSGYEDTYSNLLIRCTRTAIALQNIGIKKGNILAICSNNHPNAVVPLIAGYFIGAVIAPTDPTLCQADTTYLLNMVQPKLVFATEECEDLIMNSLENSALECRIITFANNSNKFTTFNWFLEKQDNEENFQPEICKDSNETCLILFSSGTTGLPKGICMSHKFVMNCAYGLGANKNSGRIFMGLASLYWISTIMTLTTCLIFGYKRLLCLEFKPKEIWDIIEKYNVSFVFIAPVQAIKTIAHLSEKGRNLQYLMIAGGYISPENLKILRDALPNTFVLNSYGQTEIGCISVLKEKDKNYEKLTTCGQPVAGLKIRIVDPETEQVQDLNQEGEIRIKPSYPINGYYNQKSDDVWDADGYMRTGDLGYFDDDLCLFITDREKEMFKYMAYHIVPSKLEMILQSHPQVELAVVIGVPHPSEDNHALGIVTVLNGACVTAKELEQFVEDKVDERNRLRAGVLIVDSAFFPMTPTGKIKRRELKGIVLKKHQNV